MKRQGITKKYFIPELFKRNLAIKTLDSIFLRSVFAVLLLMFFVFSAWGQDISKELKIGHKVVRILDNEGLVPSTVIVARGTTVIWVSYFRDPVQIKFTGSRITTACRQPTNFITDKDGTYQSNILKAGATASLCFIEKGEYEYQFKPRNVEWANIINNKNLKGVIKVH